MSATAVAPAALDRAAAPTPAPALSLEARMAAVDAAMDVRLQEAGLAHDVNTAHIATPVLDLADVIRGPVTAPRTPVDLYPTPVANLLQRAHQRLVDGGWCAGSVSEQGAMCLQAAIYKEAGGRYGLASDGLDVVMDAIRSQFGPAESVPAFNDAWGDATVPLRVLQQAADHAAVRGI